MQNTLFSQWVSDQKLIILNMNLWREKKEKNYYEQGIGDWSACTFWIWCIQNVLIIIIIIIIIIITNLINLKLLSLLLLLSSSI